ncbi:MAG: hypothetical protein IPM64_17980 [Phycisphaerales bacterium]|nr:hypothetical protein [Phycisphaerales bacterium]
MGTFRYYLPRALPNAAGRVDRAVLEARGLWDRLDDVVTGQLAHDRYSANHLRQGPDGGEGLLLVPEPHDGSVVERAAFVPEHQTWWPGEGPEVGGRRPEISYWIGIDRDYPPTPAGLARRDLVGGYEHTLGDGHVWVCPTIRRALFLPGVPCSYAKVGGELVREPLPQYARIFRRTLEFAARFAAGEAPPAADQWDLAVACLAVNYRVSNEEVSQLRLINDRTLELVMDAAFDLPWLREATSGADPQKKRAWEAIRSALASTSAGDPESFPNTTPPLPT